MMCVRPQAVPTRRKLMKSAVVDLFYAAISAEP